jgi:hypothetical protein
MAVLLLPISAVAVQTPVLDGEMKKLEFLVGEWKGEDRDQKEFTVAYKRRARIQTGVSAASLVKS